MSDRRRGLGRGLGALIPTSSEGARPVDVFFPSSSPTADGPEESTVAVATVSVPEALEGLANSDGGTDATAAGDADALHAREDAGEHDESVDQRGSATPSAPADAEDGSTSSGAVVTGVDSPLNSSAPMSSRNQADEARAESGPARQESAAGEARAADVPRETPSDDGLVPVPGATFAELGIDAIHPNARQPRTVFDEGELDELIGSIRQIGVLQPIVVRADGDGYELIMGERRWRASRAAGLDTIPAIIRSTDDADMLRDALLENLHRAALNPLEEAAAYRQLLDDFGCTHEELASRISRSRPQISNTLRLLKLPPLVQRRVAAGVLSAGHARALLSLDDPAAAEQLAQRIVAEGLSVRATEEIVALGGLDDKPKRAPRAGQRIQAIEDLSSRLSDRFETRVKVNLGKNKGRLTVEFASVEDLNRILDVMAPQDPGVFRENG
ncbi:chromosome segregation DNA-binding protein [Paraoerskovia marina]|uniref:Chromosome segregation DNA-binding protein n=1 Tax=Paraoerskovia marina TaxID=545619 RepID=A0A1H1N3Z8_9CELL|nr:ParB/RepB/Spo0J family partition protein [Paraoerskovia marina]SDR93851.1 chromosome segregation DNA-binding protein [Paraoerskovia marina]